MIFNYSIYNKLGYNIRNKTTCFKTGMAIQKSPMSKKAISKKLITTESFIYSILIEFFIYYIWKWITLDSY